MKRFLKITAGTCLVVFGIVGLFLPFLQGILMIIGGLALLGSEIPAVRAFNIRLKRWAKERYRRLKRLYR